MKFNQYLTYTYQYIIASYRSHNIFFLLILIHKVFIINARVKENSFAWNLQRDELLQYWNIQPKNKSDKRQSEHIAITSSNFTFLLFLGVPQGFILSPLFFLIYINNSLLHLMCAITHTHTHTTALARLVWCI